MDPADLQIKSGGVPWVTAAWIRASGENIRSSLGGTSELLRDQGRVCRWCPPEFFSRLELWQTWSLSLRMMLQGQINRPLSHAGWRGCVLVPCLGSACVWCPAQNCLWDCYSAVKPRIVSPSGHYRQALKKYSLSVQGLPTDFSEAVVECW